MQTGYRAASRREAVRIPGAMVRTATIDASPRSSIRDIIMLSPMALLTQSQSSDGSKITIASRFAATNADNSAIWSRRKLGISFLSR